MSRSARLSLAACLAAAALPSSVLADDTPSTAAQGPALAAADVPPVVRPLPLPPSPPAAPTSTAAATAGPWAVVGRTIGADRDPWLCWVIDYRLRNDGDTPLTLPPAALSARVEGWVSNSRVAGHAAPRRSVVVAAGSSGAATISGTADLVLSGDEVKRCRERATLWAWPETLGNEPPTAPASADEPLPAPTVPPGGILRVRLRLDHEHHLYGPYNALLGRRSLELRLGPATIRDDLRLDDEPRVARGLPAWPPSAPPADRLDGRVFVSAPNSLHLEAHVGGGTSYGFPDRPVQYSTRMRLKFWYLVAPGTEGTCIARVTQHRDLPNSWKVLRDGELELPLTTVGRWVQVERVFTTESEATTLTLEFRIAGHADMGELWLDDVTLEPAAESPHRP